MGREMGQDEIVHKEKLAAIGKLSRSISHDIKNPLGAISNSIFYLEHRLNQLDDEKINRHLFLMKGEVARIDGILNNLSELVVSDLQVAGEADLNSLVRSVVSSTIIPQHVEVRLQLDDTLPRFRFDEKQMIRVIDNLLSNSIEAIAKEGTVKISTGRSGENVMLIFADDGCGISKETLQNIFDPLFTTKHKGIGFGLSAVKSLVEGHGGRVEVASEPGVSTTVEVLLPFG